MTDELIRSLQRDWQSQEYDASHVIRRLRRARWTPHLVFALEVRADRRRKPSTASGASRT